MKVKILTPLILMAASTATQASPGWEQYPAFQGPGHAGIEIGDFDGNGTVEAAVTAYSQPGYTISGTQLLAVLGRNGGEPLSIRSISMLPWSLQGSLITAPSQGSAARLAALGYQNGANNQILILGGVPMHVLRTIEAPMIERVVAIADIDADGQLEVVGLTSAYTWSTAYPVVLDYATGVVEWTGTDPVSDVGVAQLDADPALELIMAGTPGRVLDGASHAVEWNYPAGFENRILVGSFNQNASVPGFAVAGYSRVQIFRAQPYSPVSEFFPGEVAVARRVRMTPSGVDEIAIGNGQWGDVAIYDPRSGQRIFGSTNPEHGVSALAVGDVDGDGRAEIVFGAGLTSSGADLLRVVDLGNGTVDFNQIDEVGPYSAVASGDLVGGGSDQVAYLTTGAVSGYQGPNLHVLDRATGTLLRSRSDLFSWSYGGALHIASTQTDTDPQAEIVATGVSSGSGVVAALDGVSLADQWRVGGFNSIFDNAVISGMGLLDVNGDGFRDVVVATSAVRIVVLNGRNGALLWQSVTLNGSSNPALAVFRADTGAPRAALTVGSALYIFDLSTHLLVSSRDVGVTLTGLSLWGEGSSCRLGALDSASIVSVFTCSNLSPDGQRLMPPGTEFFRPIDAQASRFAAAAGSELFEVFADGTSVAIARLLGAQLGSGNMGEVAVAADGQHLDAVLGSDFMVMRLHAGFDAIFANGYD